MALDYSMTKNALNSAVSNKLLNAQNVGQSASVLGFLGADKLRQGGGLMELLKSPKQFGRNIKQFGYDKDYGENKAGYDAMYQQGLKDNPGLMEDDDQYWDNPDNFEQEDLNGNSNVTDYNGVSMTPAIWDNMNESEQNIFRANLKKKKDSGKWYNKLGWFSPSLAAQTPFVSSGGAGGINPLVDTLNNESSIFNKEEFVDPLLKPGGGFSFNTGNSNTGY